ncbi:hypothetical protein QWJ34_22220 [Saccharibacillus sp. CPCC 101409]|uniref:hypothetical protein n=1 Tax=Saccharibacillus sp. CPCC 101409 TaxID=3058041 RepID=UPI00267131B7|nr:hypothetical protein [Saccharibacillus sp. CPCC 101409]MDO3412497.1 hypothetical protein [Saccharibacillus sp. CPCC 101409]
MSLFAEFRLLPVDRLDELERHADVEAEGFAEFGAFVESHSRRLSDYDGSGYVYSTLLEYLFEQQIDLEESAFGELAARLSGWRYSLCLLLTEEHKREYLEMLNPDNFDPVELGCFYNDFNDTQSTDMGGPMLEATRVLHRNLREVGPETVLMLTLE